MEDPESIEEISRRFPVSVFCPQCTVIEQEKITRQSDFAFSLPRRIRIVKDTKYIWDEPPYGGDAPEQPVARLEDGRTDGYYLNNRCWGSYMHGIL